VANSVLYTNFGGKDGLVVVAYLLSRRRWWWHLLEEEAGRAESPRVPAFFDVYPSDPGNSRGSDAFLNVPAELTDRYPAHEIIRNHHLTSGAA